MSSVSAQKKNPARRAAKKQTLSTSQARANFADALGMAQEQSTIIGFDRYGKLIAAVVPIDAVRMLARRGDEVDPAVRLKIERMARSMLQVAAPAGAPSAAAMLEEAAALKPRSKEKRKRRKDKREKKKKRKAKAASGKRARKISRKI